MKIGRSLCEPDYGPDHDDALDKAAEALCELASFARDAQEDDPSACIRTAANNDVNEAYARGGMQAVRAYVEHYEAEDRTLRMNALRNAA